MPPALSSQLARFVEETTSLYSLPAVAMEVVELTRSPTVDAQELKECIQRDPALTVRVLRVVNSSLFGLSGKVGNLGQAIPMIGARPLKLLVLGFSLPEGLFLNLAGKPLERFWTTTLARAVAAKLIAEKWFPRAADDAFTAGLLQDIGVLALVNQLGEKYLHFLHRVDDELGDLRRLEHNALGFDHTRLSAALLRKWRLPELLATAIEDDRVVQRLARQAGPSSALPKLLHLADLVAELVARRRLAALPELTEAAEAYCGMQITDLKLLVSQLEPQVAELADAFSAPLDDDRDFNKTLLDAYALLSAEAEQAAADLLNMSSEESAEQKIALDSDELLQAVGRFLASDRKPSQSSTEIRPRKAEPEKNSRAWVVEATAFAAERCRAERHELSLILFELHGCTGPDPLGKALVEASLATDFPGAQRLRMPGLEALLLPRCDRSEAVSVASRAALLVSRVGASQAAGVATQTTVTKAGVASIAAVPNRFDAEKLVEAAERCLSATRVAGATDIKSIEVY